MTDPNALVERGREIAPHFKAYELYTKGAHGFAPRAITEKMLEKYKPTLEFLERLRFLINWIRHERMGQDYIEQGIHVTSAYRHRSYNRKIKSSDTSCHTDPTPTTTFAPCAIDAIPYPLKGEGSYSIITYDEFHQCVILVAESYPEEGWGIGYYGRSLFVHIDSGHGKRQRRWIGN